MSKENLNQAGFEVFSKITAGTDSRSAMRELLRIVPIIGLFILLASCGNWGWESIETDNEEQLNVFGLISLDDSLESFIIIHKTLDTAGPDQITVRQDTVFYETWSWYNQDLGIMVYDTSWYDPPWVRSIFESLYLVKDAEVSISDGNQSYLFERNQLQDPNGGSFWDGNLFQDQAIYKNIDGTFEPTPNTEYLLHVSTPDGLELNGSLPTPSIPHINESELSDT
ncbi:MAG: hypothetical protein L3J79_12810, partial [Candidatus Marinimicrobia bacterium]|nr:hypothetical protein [Candidatus Neomarinimicrobiota bacterium]